MIKKLLTAFIFLVLIGLLFAWFLFGIKPWTSFFSYSTEYEIEIPTKKETIQIEKNLRQSNYDCGAYNVWATLQALGINKSVEDVVKLNREKMIPNLGVVPEVIQRAFQKTT